MNTCDNQGRMQDFWKGGGGSIVLGLHAKGGGGSNVGLNVKKPTSWAKRSARSATDNYWSTSHTLRVNLEDTSENLVSEQQSRQHFFLLFKEEWEDFHPRFPSRDEVGKVHIPQEESHKVYVWESL